MNAETASLCFSKLGHQRRLEIIRLLVQSAPDGLTMGQIANQTKIPDSTLTHHIVLLEQSGLITRHSVNESIRCIINIKLIQKLANFLLDECCTNSKKSC